MEQVRKPFQGIKNIIRFNWHFYLLASSLILLLVVTGLYAPAPFRLLPISLSFLVAATTLTSLLVSFYVYDLSGLYNFAWLNNLINETQHTIVNIHAGFDETSALLNKKLAGATLTVLDFYDPSKHTEVSIKRARKAYPPYPHTQRVETTKLSLQAQSADLIFTIFAAHEIRDNSERTLFFQELNRSLTAGGKIVVVEHLRDVANFLAYNIGFLHFHSRSSWLQTFHSAELIIEKEIKLTPFISTFILKKHGASS